MVALCVWAPAASAEGPDCSGVAGPLAVRDLALRVPGGDWEVAPARICAQLGYRERDGHGETARYAVLTLLLDGQRELAAAYPAGTQVSVTIASGGPAPLIAVGMMRDLRARTAEGTITVQGRTAGGRFAREIGADGAPDCAGPVDGIASQAGFSVMLDPGGTSLMARWLRAYRGAFFGTNAQSHGLPMVRRTGFELYVAGCGDGDPATADGFFEGFMPRRALAGAGIGGGLLRRLPPSAIEQLLTLRDNGARADGARLRTATAADLALDAAPGVDPGPASGRPAGVTIDYEMGFSAHLLEAVADRRATRRAQLLVKRCRHGVRVKRLRGGKQRMSCRPRPRRRR